MKYLATVALVGLVASSAFGVVVAPASQNFDGIPVAGTQYVDLDPNNDHALPDHPGEPAVNWPSGVGEIGFSSYYTNTRGGGGLSDGDWVGVTDFTGVVGAYTTPENGFQIADADGLMTTTMDGVTGAVSMSVDIWVQETGYEADDVLRVWVDDNGATIDLVNTAGSDINDLGIEGFWWTLSTPLSGVGEAVLAFELDSNSASEALFVDTISFIPEPGSLALIALGGLALLRRRG